MVGVSRRAAAMTRRAWLYGALILGAAAGCAPPPQPRIGDRRISTRVDAIVLAPQHSQTMVPPVRRAVEQHIPVVIIDSGLDDRDLIVKYIATDNYNGGVLAARRLLDVLKAEGKAAPRIILLRYAVGS